MNLEHYSSEQVLAWWREYALGTIESGPVGPRGYPKSTVALDPVSGGIRYDRRYIGWLHVERFFAREIEWFGGKAHLLMNEPTPARAAFERWYQTNPLLITCDLHGVGRVLCPELIPKALPDALDEYNASAKPKKRRIRNAAYEAIKRGHLAAWRPKGHGWITTQAEIEVWVSREWGAA